MSKEELLQAVDYVAKGACKAHLGCSSHAPCAVPAPCSLLRLFSNLFVSTRMRSWPLVAVLAVSGVPYPILHLTPPRPKAVLFVDRFAIFAYLIAVGPPIAGITNELKLKFYALYKQATKGECAEKEPSRLQVVQRMKWYGNTFNH